MSGAPAKGEKGWRASAVPLSPTLPILPKPYFEHFSSREEASVDRQGIIDGLLGPHCAGSPDRETGASLELGELSVGTRLHWTCFRC